MKRSTWEGDSLVYSYGARRAVLPVEAEQQLSLAHELRNRLVEIELRLDSAISSLWLTHPEVAAASLTLDNAYEALSNALEVAQETKRRTGSGRVPAEVKMAATAARMVVREAKVAQRAAKDSAYDVIKPALVELRSARDAERKGTYKEFCQERGLYWPTYNDVAARHDTAVRRVASMRKAGRPAQLRFHRWTGEGTLTIQLQREASDPPRDPIGLSDGSSQWRNSVQLPYIDPKRWAKMSRAGQRHAGRQDLSIRIGTSPDRTPIWWTIPVAWHRPLPHDAEVTSLQVTRRKVAGHYRHQVGISIRVPKPDENTTGAAIAFNLGWRSLGDGSYRVATWTANRPLRLKVSEELREWVQPRGRTGEIIIPAFVGKISEHLDGLRGLRDDKLNIVRTQLVEWLTENPDTARYFDLDPVNVAKWRSPARMASFIIGWRELKYDSRAEKKFRERLEAWRKQDKHLWEWEANERDQLIARRRDVYRKVARLLTSKAGLLAIEDIDLSALARIPSAEVEDETQAKRARSQRVIAAPGLLRQSLTQCASRLGVPVMAVNPAGITRTHFRCGTDLSEKGADFAAGIRVWCPICEESVDQDFNACQHILDRAVPGLGIYPPAEPEKAKVMRTKVPAKKATG